MSLEERIKKLEVKLTADCEKLTKATSQLTAAKGLHDQV